MLVLKKIAARFPPRLQTELRRLRYGRQIKNGTFVTEEPEYKILHNYIHPGDWVLDIGANIGHYTKRFSELVGAHGRVIAFEPVPITFSILSGNAQMFANQNVSLINAAVSDRLDVVGMSTEEFSTGLTNYYQAHLSPTSSSALSVITLSLDSLGLENKIAFIKIDVEGHESFVLAGMRKLLEASHPVLIIETDSKGVIDDLTDLGYVPEKLPNSPNIIFKPKI